MQPPAQHVDPFTSKRYGFSPSQTPVSEHKDERPISVSLDGLNKAINFGSSKEPVIVVGGLTGKLEPSRRIPADQTSKGGGIEA
jgi:hypothetical protein